MAREGATVFARESVINNAGGNAILCQNGAKVVFLDGTATNASGDAGFLAEDGGYISADGATVTGCLRNVFARRGGRVAIDRGALTGAVSRGLYAVAAGQITATFANFRKGASDDPTDAEVGSGGTIVATNATGGFSKTPNVVTGAGLIVSSAVVRNASVATVSSGATSIVVNHGLSVQPTGNEIQVTPRNSLGSATKFWFDTVGATSFTIHVDTDPGAGGAVFAWRAAKES